MRIKSQAYPILYTLFHVGKKLAKKVNRIKLWKISRLNYVTILSKSWEFSINLNVNKFIFLNTKTNSLLLNLQIISPNIYIKLYYEKYFFFVISQKSSLRYNTRSPSEYFELSMCQHASTSINFVLFLIY